MSFALNYYFSRSHILKSFVAVVFLLSSGIACAQSAAAPATGTTNETERPSTMILQGHEIDTYQGNLSISHADVLLKGNGGLDIVVNRAYSSQATGANWRNSPSYVPSHKWLGMGLGWTFHVAPRVTIDDLTVPTTETEYLSLCRKEPWQSRDTSRYILEHTDGRTERLLRSAEIGLFISASNWRLTCPGVGLPFQLQDPDGKIYILGDKLVNAINGGEPNGGGNSWDYTGALDVVMQATKIVDKNGNWISIEYQMLQQGAHALFPLKANLPKTINSSDGRKLEFTYADNGIAGQPVRLLRIDGPGGAVWQYKHQPAVVPQNSSVFDTLTEVVRPDGMSWKFTYHPMLLEYPYTNANGSLMKTMQLPTGGIINY
jgi:hypothetical protein